MYKNVLVPIAFDHDRDSREALKIAMALAGEDGTITALHVMEEIPAYVSQYLPEGRLADNKAELLAKLGTDLADLKSVKPVVVTGHPGHAIIEYAKENAVDCIVVASHKPGLQDYFLGSTAARVVRHADCAVHVSR